MQNTAESEELTFSSFVKDMVSIHLEIAASMEVENRRIIIERDRTREVIMLVCGEDDRHQHMITLGMTAAHKARYACVVQEVYYARLPQDSPYAPLLDAGVIRVKDLPESERGDLLMIVAQSRSGESDVRYFDLSTTYPRTATPMDIWGAGEGPGAEMLPLFLPLLPVGDMSQEALVDHTAALGEAFLESLGVEPRMVYSTEGGLVETVLEEMEARMGAKPEA